jgi:hypothetical protein
VTNLILGKVDDPLFPLLPSRRGKGIAICRFGEHSLVPFVLGHQRLMGGIALDHVVVNDVHTLQAIIRIGTTGARATALPLPEAS